MRIDEAPRLWSCVERKLTEFRRQKDGSVVSGLRNSWVQDIMKTGIQQDWIEDVVRKHCRSKFGNGLAKDKDRYLHSPIGGRWNRDDGHSLASSATEFLQPLELRTKRGKAFDQVVKA
jgi:hypothetical protein